MTTDSFVLTQACWALAAILLLGGCASTQAGASGVALAASVPAGQGGAPTGLRPRAQLPSEVREALTARMMRHGDEMSALTSAVLMLEYDMTHALAKELADEPRLGRPASGEKGTLNALLPAAFFTEQDALVASARALAAAAQDHDDSHIVASFGDVTRSCVGCHSAYLRAEVDSAGQEALDRALPCNPADPCGEREQR